MKKTCRRLFTLLIGTAMCLSLALPAAAAMDVTKFNGDIFSKEQTVALGTNAEFMLKSDDSLWAWGDNTYGEIGNGNGFAPYFKNGYGWVNPYVTTPYKVLDNVRDFSAEGTWAITKDNALWVWGKTAYILGLADSAKTSTPKKYMDNVRWFAYGESRDNPVVGWPYDAESMNLKYNMFLVKTDGNAPGLGPQCLRGAGGRHHTGADGADSDHDRGPLCGICGGAGRQFGPPSRDTVVSSSSRRTTACGAGAPARTPLLTRTGDK